MRVRDGETERDPDAEERYTCRNRKSDIAEHQKRATRTLVAGENSECTPY